VGYTLLHRDSCPARNDKEKGGAAGNHGATNNSVFSPFRVSAIGSFPAGSISQNQFPLPSPFSAFKGSELP
jgi:hypothetical protein